MFELPDWTMPPPMVGGHVAGPVLIGGSVGLVMAVRQVMAYPTGVEFDIEAQARGPVGPDAPHGHEALRFRVELADGTHVIGDDDTGLRSGRGPMLVVSRQESSWGGPENREQVRLSLWLWPLPPPGPLTLTCEWVQRGEATLVLDGQAILTAAGHAVAFWPDES
jgi:hypothetical protein